MAHLITTLGPKRADELALILPHEHVFVDLRTPDQEGHAQADVAQVLQLMEPEIERARAVGVTALVECTPVGGCVYRSPGAIAFFHSVASTRDRSYTPAAQKPAQ